MPTGCQGRPGWPRACWRACGQTRRPMSARSARHGSCHATGPGSPPVTGPNWSMRTTTGWQPPPREDTEAVATFVLVHGAWGGAHGFGKVRRLLQADGHAVFTPSLTGIGERVHLASPHVCLTTRIADVANAVLYEDLDGIVLLGFSYGGLVVTGALEHIAGRISHLVYLDAFVPADRDSLNALIAAASPAPAIGPGVSWLVPPMARDFDDPAEA